MIRRKLMIAPLLVLTFLSVGSFSGYAQNCNAQAQELREELEELRDDLYRAENMERIHRRVADRYLKRMQEIGDPNDPTYQEYYAIVTDLLNEARRYDILQGELKAQIRDVSYQLAQLLQQCSGGGF